MANELYNCLTDTDKYLIEEYVSAFGSSHGSVNAARRNSLDIVLREWDTQKADLFKLLGGQLIVSRPYAYTINEEGLERLFNQGNNDPMCYTFMNWYRRLLNRDNSLSRGDKNLLNYMLETEVLSVNSYTGNSAVVQLPDGPFKIQRGMKPMKVFSKIAQLYGCEPAVLEDFRIWHSKMLNQKTLDGQLCLSIHPLDYMTMSDNANDWESCMHWVHDDDDPGDYRAGTVECMNSPYILVAYLHNPKHTMNGADNNYFPELPNDWDWNSKKWRELFIINDGLITEIKGYPYQDEPLTNTVLMWIKELAALNMGWHYGDEEISIKEPFPYKQGKAKIQFRTTSHMYCDMGTLAKHRGRINTKVLPKYEAGDAWTRMCYNSETNENYPLYTLSVPYGGIQTCMCCGGYGNFKADSVLCDNCEPGYYCAMCGDWIDGDEIWIEDYDGPICYGCYEYYCANDDLTDEPHKESNLTPIFLLKDFVTETFNDEEITYPRFYQSPINVYEPLSNGVFLDYFKTDDNEGIKTFVISPYKSVNFVTEDDFKKDKETLYDIFNVDPDDEDEYSYYMPTKPRSAGQLVW